MNNKITKSLIALSLASVLGVAAMPAAAEAKSSISIINGWNKIFVNSEINTDNSISVSNNFGLGFNNATSSQASQLKDARKAYNQAIKDANSAYNASRKTARDKFHSALKLDRFDFAKYINAYKIYLSDMLSAQKTKSTAQDTALQNYITAISNIQATNQAPTANNQSVTLAENTTKAITLTATDPENNTLTYTVVANPAHGVLSGTAPNLTYVPNANFNGTDSFTFRANDGVQNSNTATVSITVTNVNQAPVANSQSVTTAKNTAKVITLTGSDVDNNTLSFYVVANPAHGTLSGTVPNLTYFPATDYTGADSFTFKVNDGTVDSPTATISITVNP